MHVTCMYTSLSLSIYIYIHKHIRLEAYAEQSEFKKAVFLLIAHQVILVGITCFVHLPVILYSFHMC